MEPSTSAHFPAAWTVQRARDAYLAENGFSVAAYADKYTKATVFGLDLMVPNTAKHRWAIMLHDLHHVATGFGTDLIGEGEISAWEARRGLRSVGAYVGAIIAGGGMLGMLVAPKRTREAWRASRARGSLFDTDVPYETLLAMTVGELRALLGVPHDGLAFGPRRLHARAPTSAFQSSG